MSKKRLEGVLSLPEHKGGPLSIFRTLFFFIICTVIASILLFPCACTSTSDAHRNNDYGMEKLSEGKVNAAIYFFDLALTADPDYFYAHNNLGLAYAEKGLEGRAISELKEAIRIKPDYAKAHYFLGEIYYRQGEYDLAMKRFRESTRLEPDDEEYHYWLGKVYFKKGLYNFAIRQFEEAVNLKPDYAGPRMSLDTVYKLREEAKAASMQGVVRGPSDGVVQPSASAKEGAGHEALRHFNAGVSLAREGRLDSAADEFQEAIKLKPDYAEAYDQLGLVYAKKGQYNLAVELVEEAVRLKPDYANAYDNLSKLYYKRSQYGIALEQDEKVVELRGDRTVPFVTRINLPGLEAKLDANRGKVIILDFWEHDEDNCQRAAPFMNRMYTKYKRQGLLIIGLSIDEDHDDARFLMTAAGTKYPTFMADDMVQDAYGLRFVPYYVYIDREGKVRGEDVGFYEDKKNEIENKIVELLKESG